MTTGVSPLAPRSARGPTSLYPYSDSGSPPVTADTPSNDLSAPMTQPLAMTWRKIEMPKKTTRNDRSNIPAGMTRRTGASTGSVTVTSPPCTVARTVPGRRGTRTGAPGDEHEQIDLEEDEQESSHDPVQRRTPPGSSGRPAAPGLAASASSAPDAPSRHRSSACCKMVHLEPGTLEREMTALYRRHLHAQPRTTSSARCSVCSTRPSTTSSSGRRRWIN